MHICGDKFELPTLQIKHQLDKQIVIDHRFNPFEAGLVINHRFNTFEAGLVINHRFNPFEAGLVIKQI